MAIADLSALIAAISNPDRVQSLRVCRLGRVGGSAAATPIAQVPFTTWQYEGDGAQGAAPGSTPATHTSASQGAIRLNNATGGRNNYLIGGCISNFTSGYCMLIDRLASVSGLSGTETSEQSFSSSLTLPSRASSGVGVMAALEVYTQIGGTGTTVQLKYTNTDDTTGKLAPATIIGGTNSRNAQLWRPIPLASGDLGIKSAQSVDLLATTGTVGDWGIVLYKLLAIFPFNQPRSFLSGVPELPIIHADACLQIVGVPSTAVAAVLEGTLTVVEG